MNHPIIQAQCVQDMSEADYAALPYVSASKIRVAINHNHEEAMKVFSKTSFNDPHSLGRWLHYMLLEAPDMNPQVFIGCPTHLHSMLEKAKQAFTENLEMVDLISSSKTEQTFLWNDPLVEGSAKARIDAFNHHEIWDLKCIRGGSDLSSFNKKLKRMSWAVQAWWYQRAIEKVLEKRLSVGFIILDTQTWKFRKQVLTKSDLEKASNQARESIRKLRRWGLI